MSREDEDIQLHGKVCRAVTEERDANGLIGSSSALMRIAGAKGAPVPG